ncbi:hypothetical protein B6U99_05600 [Candidatus Geothermarchaeota archaeon ex4572_27]|nr:MAG: hypothetical protein B6U99_05600 [Candidatus Geothermarchaeota archaeon ex4572_27]
MPAIDELERCVRVRGNAEECVARVLARRGYEVRLVGREFKCEYGFDVLAYEPGSGMLLLIEVKEGPKARLSRTQRSILELVNSRFANPRAFARIYARVAPRPLAELVWEYCEISEVVMFLVAQFDEYGNMIGDSDTVRFFEAMP